QFSGVSVKELREALNFGYDIMRVSFTGLLAAVGFVLLIACVNVASLTLARARARERDVAVRSALGARRGRIVRQLLTESLLLALLGGGLGVFLADRGARAIAPLVPEDIFRVGDVELDTTVLLFSVAVTLLTPVLFGLAPAIGISRTNLVSSLKQGVRAGGAGIGSMRVRRALVVLEVTLAIALVVGTGLMVRSFFELQKVELGFRPESALTVRLALPQTDYPDAPEQKLFFDRALLEVSSLPGVRAAGYTVPLPMNHAIWTVQFALPDDAPAARESWPLAHQFNVSSRYFEAMGVALLAGRAFDERDGPDSARVVIVSRSTADAYWPDRNPVGESLLVLDSEGTFEATVVGVVADVRHEGFQDEIGAQIYQAIDQGGFRGRFLVVSSDAEPGNLTRAVAGAIAAADPNLPVEIRPMADIVSESALQWTISSILLGVFGAVALLLASLGIYGVVAFTVAERRREIGIRMALGATSREIGALVLSDGLKLTAVGIALGIVLAAIAARLVASQLFGVSPFDPATFVVAVLLFTATSAFASLAPTLRASSTDPIVVLRNE
ncbi:MAG TPA: FtsX-like permease family protein, partial [Vicinamibacteria bacterium]|nr:FtsX-like permease family protein [Vicinamibacteria bacterium]